LNKTYPLKKLIFALFLINSLCLYTQTKSFVREYTYKAGEADSKLSSKTLALNEVKTLLLEEIGVYLSSEFENKIDQKQVNGKTEFKQLTKSNIRTLAAGITKTTILDEKWNGETYYLKAEIIVDIDDTKRKLKELVNDKAKTKELEDLQAKNKEANDVIDKLKKELETAKAKNIELSEKDKTKIQEDYNAKINILDANEWFQKGLDAHDAKDAIIYYNKAIQLKPDYSEAYCERGLAKRILRDYNGAITDYNKAIQLNPDYAHAYNNRGVVKKMTSYDYTAAIADYSKAIQLKPDYAEPYNNRGNAKSDLQDYTGAIADYSKAIQLNPDYADSYYNRASAKYSLKDMNGACRDWNKYIQLEPDDADAYSYIQRFCK
jgi:tetratricopeptide (TPR) repeat protein